MELRDSGAVGQRQAPPRLFSAQLLVWCSTEKQMGSSSVKEAAVDRRCLREKMLRWLRCGI